MALLKTLHIHRIAIIAVLTLLSISALLLYGPIAQPIVYHDFADKRDFFAIANTYDVMSNIGFFVIGALGLGYLWKKPSFAHQNALRVHDYWFFAGVFLTALGSGYYHLAPNNATLFWDRLPMSISFMALFSIIIGEQISTRFARSVLFTTISFGVFSVIYWYLSEQQGNGDLRPYILVQFLSMLILPLLLLADANKPATRYLWLMLLFYALSKVFEAADDFIFSLTTEIISGHTLKHLCAAIGVYFYLRRCQLHPTN